jgi:hypothetical protein
MAWYVAHGILVQEPIDEPRDNFLVWENLYLIEAGESEDPWPIAESRAALDATADEADYNLEDGRPSSTIDGRPARWRFVGVRKIVVVRHDSEDGILCPGDELSFNEFVTNSAEEVEAFARGEAVSIRRTAEPDDSAVEETEPDQEFQDNSGLHSQPEDQ